MISDEAKAKMIRKATSECTLWSCEEPSASQFVQIKAYNSTRHWQITVQLHHYGKPPSEKFNPEKHEHYYSIHIEDLKYEDGLGSRKKLVVSIKADEPDNIFFSLLRNIFQVNLPSACTPPLENGKKEIFSGPFLKMCEAV